MRSAASWRSHSCWRSSLWPQSASRPSRRPRQAQGRLARMRVPRQQPRRRVARAVPVRRSRQVVPACSRTSTRPPHRKTESGIALLYAGQVDDALSAATAAAERLPAFPHPHYVIGLAARAQGRADDAVSGLSKSAADGLRPMWAAGSTSARSTCSSGRTRRRLRRSGKRLPPNRSTSPPHTGSRRR